MADKAEGVFLPQDPVPLRVVIPAKVAFNLDGLLEVTKNLARELGCEACLSGRSCLFEFERDYVVNPETFEVRGFAQRF